MIQTDFLIIGSGMAGLHLALCLEEHGNVTIITKDKIQASSSYLAQGGIAAVVDYNDSFEEHIQNTLEAGSYHNDKEVVRFLVEQAPAAIERLEKLGVAFQKDTRQEGGHSFPRIHHTLDQTGKSISDALIARIQKSPRIEILEDAPCVLLQQQPGECISATCWDEKETRIDLVSKFAILATGGLGQIYSRTTNPSVATGDGIALANEIGAEMMDLEFVQFHPTAFWHEDKVQFLLSETLRGEGALLRNAKKEIFMSDYHADAELAPRDIISQAIWEEEQDGPVYLDARQIPNVEQKFPFLFEKLQEHGFDLSQDLIPISPAAHYSCGGIKTNAAGETSVPGLYAIGEVACCGLHGANRLASNSLLETIVMAQPLVESIVSKVEKTLPEDPILYELYASSEDPKSRQTIQETMWKYVGIKRSPEGLQKALDTLEALPEFTNYETRNMLTVAKLVTKAAMARKESLGCHWMG